MMLFQEAMSNSIGEPEAKRIDYCGESYVKGKQSKKSDKEPPSEKNWKVQ